LELDANITFIILIKDNTNKIHKIVKFSINNCLYDYYCLEYVI
jgi:hypothetical protein